MLIELNITKLYSISHLMFFQMTKFGCRRGGMCEYSVQSTVMDKGTIFFLTTYGFVQILRYLGCLSRTRFPFDDEDLMFLDGLQ